MRGQILDGTFVMNFLEYLVDYLVHPDDFVEFWWIF